MAGKPALGTRLRFVGWARARERIVLACLCFRLRLFPLDESSAMHACAAAACVSGLGVRMRPRGQRLILCVRVPLTQRAAHVRQMRHPCTPTLQTRPPAGSAPHSTRPDTLLITAVRPCRPAVSVSLAQVGVGSATAASGAGRPTRAAAASSERRRVLDLRDANKGHVSLSRGGGKGGCGRRRCAGIGFGARHSSSSASCHVPCASPPGRVPAGVALGPRAC